MYTDAYLTLRHTYVNNGGRFAYKENNKILFVNTCWNK
jgi:hypothetical protein